MPLLKKKENWLVDLSGSKFGLFWLPRVCSWCSITVWVWWVGVGLVDGYFLTPSTLWNLVDPFFPRPSFVGSICSSFKWRWADRRDWLGGIVKDHHGNQLSVRLHCFLSLWMEERWVLRSMARDQALWALNKYQMDIAPTVQFTGERKQFLIELFNRKYNFYQSKVKMH